MSYEAATDPLVSTMLALAKSAANAELLATLGASFPAVVGTYNFPANLQLISALQLPALTLYRKRESDREPTFGHRDDRRIAFEAVYMLPSTPPDVAALRWPLLRHVWEHVITAWECGYHASYSSGAQVLQPIGVIEGAMGAQKDERWADSGTGQVFPAFVTTFQIDWRDPTDQLASLDPFVGVDAAYHIDNDGTVIPPDVQDEINP